MTMYSEEAERLVPPPLCPIRCDIDRSARRQTFSSVQSYREIMNVKEAAAGEIDLLDPPVHRCCVTYNRDRSSGSIDNLFNISMKLRRSRQSSICIRSISIPSIIRILLIFVKTCADSVFERKTHIPALAHFIQKPKYRDAVFGFEDIAVRPAFPHTPGRFTDLVLEAVDVGSNCKSFQISCLRLTPCIIING